ncbi:MAG: type II toxin-antitoxin system RelE/ParE family toxin [Deltaproteobacteria bacterium]
MTFSFHPEAKDEFNEAIEYYENCEPGLGYDFSIEAHAAIQNIADYPTVWPIIEEDVRCCLVNRFPYGIIYSIEQDGIFILAVMHQRRHPDYWKNRH